MEQFSRIVIYRLSPKRTSVWISRYGNTTPPLSPLRPGVLFYIILLYPLTNPNLPHFTTLHLLLCLVFLYCTFAYVLMLALANTPTRVCVKLASPISPKLVPCVFFLFLRAYTFACVYLDIVENVENFFVNLKNFKFWPRFAAYR